MASTPHPDELAALRREYGDSGLDHPDLAPDPIAMFRHWMHDTVVAGLHEPNAMVVSTVSADGRPSSRMVLLKGVDERGFVFYSNYDSRKGGELATNPHAALLFPWHDLQRQVRVEGGVEQLTPEESAAYFATRPRGSQLGAWASPQSDEVPSREQLESRYAEMEERFADGDVPLPPHWGGYLVRPDVVEFWQGRRGRMHDRLVYRRTGEDWVTVRLAP
jgi:pyridoxamine 5'-phosphate oxidase